MTRAVKWRYQFSNDGRRSVLTIPVGKNETTQLIEAGQLGAGNFGDVRLFKGMHPRTGAVIHRIVKRFNTEKSGIKSWKEEHKHFDNSCRSRSTSPRKHALKSRLRGCQLFTDHDTHPSRGRLVAPYIPGHHWDTMLETVLDGNERQEEQLYELLIATVDCIVALHASPHPLIHCDLKEENLLVTLEGGIFCVNPVDFGFAKSPGCPLKHLIAGKKASRYLAPEQYTGSGFASPATDVYALASMLQRTAKSFRLTYPSFINLFIAEGLSVLPSARPSLDVFRAQLAKQLKTLKALEDQSVSQLQVR